MKKRALKRALLGLPLGIAMGHVITVILSLVIGDGRFYPAVPSLAAQLGNELTAVVVQTVLCGILGAVSAGISVVWEMDQWSIAKQTGVHFSALSLVFLPIAYLNHWMERSVWGVMSYFLVFLALFVVIWVVSYFIWKRKIVQMNVQITITDPTTAYTQNKNKLVFEFDKLYTNYPEAARAVAACLVDGGANCTIKSLGTAEDATLPILEVNGVEYELRITRMMQAQRIVLKRVDAS
ncbi:MAG: DUF3021 domain-containing protein [Oscillospiraceae bacterium]|nr:DUF3021 domain-containing protein [Oscillospiraceae bacterium]